MYLQNLQSIAKIYPLEEPVKCEVKVPGSKSFTNRALIIAALAKGESTLHGYSNSDDSMLLFDILDKLGIETEFNSHEQKSKSLTVYGNGGVFKKYKGTLNIGNAGTVMRFLTALCCFIPGEILLKGNKRMHERPIKGLVDALQQLGADITYLSEIGYPPLKIKGGKLRGGKVEIKASESSQFVSALLMIAPLLDEGLEITVVDETASRPYIDMTLDVMRHFGVSVSIQHSTTCPEFISGFNIQHSTYRSANYEIEGDASCASFLFGIAAITQSTIRVTNLSPLSRQGDVRVADLLKEMGCKIKMDDDKMYIEVTGVKNLKRIKADLKNMPDALPALAMVAAFAKGVSVFSGVKNLKYKESDRIEALIMELRKMDIYAYYPGDENFYIDGGKPKAAYIETYNDHRIAMAFALAGARVKDMIIHEPGNVSKSFRNFWKILEGIGVKADLLLEGDIVPPRLVLIGFMGSGKSIIGKLLAKKLRRPFYETDDVILKLSGYKNINEIFAEKGEDYFRALEKQAVAKCALRYNRVVSCGGGVVADKSNMNLFDGNTRYIYLSASFETISNRLKGDESRPLFKDLKKAKELYKQRLPLYKKYADMIIYTDKLTSDEVVSNILSIADIHDKHNQRPG